MAEWQGDIRVSTVHTEGRAPRTAAAWEECPDVGRRRRLVSSIPHRSFMVTEVVWRAYGSSSVSYVGNNRLHTRQLLSRF